MRNQFEGLVQQVQRGWKGNIKLIQNEYFTFARIS